MPSWSSLTTSAETGPLQSSQISLSSACGSRAELPAPSTLEMSVGLVVTPSINPCSTQVRICAVDEELHVPPLLGNFTTGRKRVRRRQFCWGPTTLRVPLIASGGGEL